MTKLYLYVRRYLTVLLLISSFVAWSQTKTVTGKVTSADDGTAIPGVNILVKGTGTGTATDADGNFSIAASDNDVLVFSFVGYASQEVTVGAQSTINVSLQVDVTALSEVVVIGYGEVRKRDATGAVATLKSENFNKGIIVAPEQLLQGKIAGVNVTSASGEPGTGVTIRIRGTSSVRGGSNPLFVVDGVPLSGEEITPGAADMGRSGAQARNPLNFLNPGDIESIDVLKDASATAIYGSRGANGVVLIKTKNGKGQKGQVDFSSTFYVSQQAKYYDLLGADDFLQGVADRGGDAVGNDFGEDTDWQKEITRTAFSQRYDVSYSSSGNTSNFRASFSYDNQQGIVKESGLEKYTARLNYGNSFFNDKLNAALQGTYTRLNDENAPITDQAGFEGDLLGSVYMANPTWGTDPTFQPTNTNVNPNSMLKYHQDDATTDRFLVNLGLDYDIITDLNFKVNLGLDRSNSLRESAYSPLLNFNNGVTGNGRASSSTLYNMSNLMEAFFNYRKTFGDSKVDAVLGYSYQYFNRGGSNVQGWGFNTNDMDDMIEDLVHSADALRAQIQGAYQGFGYDGETASSPYPFFVTRVLPTTGIFNLGNPLLTTSVASVVEDTYAYSDELQSVFGRVNYSYADKYLLTATLRADGSTKFGGNNKYGYFPSFAAAWRLSDETFVPELFDDLKLRLGWGITGNQEIPHNLHQARQRYGAPSINQGGIVNNPGLNDVAFANPDLKWEETNQFNVGLDFGFLTGKLNGSIDYYHKVTTDLLIQVNAAQPSPQPFQWLNLPGEVINDGIELTLNYAAIDKPDMGFDIGFNIAYNDNVVENLNAIVDTGAISGQGLTGAFAQRIQNGQPLYAYYIREFVGFDDNGFNIYNGDFQKFVGKSPIPKVTYGLTLNFDYKNWVATLFFNGATGYYVYNNTANAYFTSGSLGNARNVTQDVLTSGESNVNAPEASTRFLQKGDHFRFNNFNIGYNFNLKSTEVFKKLNVFVGGQNLFVITQYDGLDPEVNKNKSMNGVPSLGIEYTSYPRARTFMFGLNASF